MSDAVSAGTRCMWMRGGTSKGAFFLADEVPEDRTVLDQFLLRVMGSPDPRQIDGMGGGDPLTSKVAIVSRSRRPDADVDYLFLQIFVEEPLVSDAQNCGNILAGVAPFAIERGLVTADDTETRVSIHMQNTGQIAVATVQTPDRKVSYSGDTRIDGVPGGHAPIPLEFRETAGSTCGALLPTGQACDLIEGVECTLIDNGMPCVIMRAVDVGATGYETREKLESGEYASLREKIEAIRMTAGPLMNLGDVDKKSVPKMMLVAPPQKDGAISVRSFIPRKAHASIGVLAGVTVASAALIEGSPAHAVARIPDGQRKALSVEHPRGELTCIIGLDEVGSIASAGVMRTARKIMDGEVFG